MPGVKAEVHAIADKAVAPDFDVTPSFRSAKFDELYIRKHRHLKVVSDLLKEKDNRLGYPKSGHPADSFDPGVLAVVLKPGHEASAEKFANKLSPQAEEGEVFTSNFYDELEMSVPAGEEMRYINLLINSGHFLAVYRPQTNRGASGPSNVVRVRLEKVFGEKFNPAAGRKFLEQMLLERFKECSPKVNVEVVIDYGCSYIVFLQGRGGQIISNNKNLFHSATIYIAFHETSESTPGFCEGKVLTEDVRSCLWPHIDRPPPELRLKEDNVINFIGAQLCTWIAARAEGEVLTVKVFK